MELCEQTVAIMARFKESPTAAGNPAAIVPGSYVIVFPEGELEDASMSRLAKVTACNSDSQLLVQFNESLSGDADEGTLVPTEQTLLCGDEDASRLQFVAYEVDRTGADLKELVVAELKHEHVKNTYNFLYLMYRPATEDALTLP